MRLSGMLAPEYALRMGSELQGSPIEMEPCGERRKISQGFTSNLVVHLPLLVHSAE